MMTHDSQADSAVRAHLCRLLFQDSLTDNAGGAGVLVLTCTMRSMTFDRFAKCANCHLGRRLACGGA